MIGLECIGSKNEKRYEIFDNIEKGSLIKVKKITIKVPDYLFAFYERVGKQAGGIPAEKVISDALFKLAGELSLNAIHKKADG